MKKIGLLLLALCWTLTACTPAQDSAPTVTEPTTAETLATEGETADVPAESGKVVTPIPSQLDLNNLDNCNVHVSLNEGDAYLDDTGAMQMKVTVYDSELYDMVDIAQLEVGDTIVMHGQNVPVTAFEQDEYGDKLINGEIRLRTDDDGVYYEVLENDSRYLYAVGQVTVQVSDEFLLTDSSDLDAGEMTLYPGDFLIGDARIRYPFSPLDTTMVMENGRIIAMNRVYVP